MGKGSFSSLLKNGFMICGWEKRRDRPQYSIKALDSTVLVIHANLMYIQINIEIHCWQRCRRGVAVEVLGSELNTVIGFEFEPASRLVFLLKKYKSTGSSAVSSAL